MRIVGGRFRGRDLTSPSDFRVRPTAEAVRAGLLDALAGEVQGARVLDLFAGTGVLGLEALSRGARSADFVEFRPASLHALKANVAALGLRRQTRIFKRDAFPFAEALAEDSYEVAFADPPYGNQHCPRARHARQSQGAQMASDPAAHRVVVVCRPLHCEGRTRNPSRRQPGR